MIEFGVFSPKAFASIKSLNDTTADRSFRIDLLRKKPSEKTLSASDATALATAAELRDGCHLAALEYAEVIADVYAGTAAQIWPEEPPAEAAAKLPSSDVDSRARDILTPLFAIALTADHGQETPAWYPAMLDATAAVAGVRGDTGNDELNLIAAATVLKDYGPDMDPFAITGQQAFGLFKASAELSWLDGDGGAKALLRRLGLYSGTQRRERFVVKPSGSKPTAKGYLVKRADLDDILARYQPGTTPEEDA